MQSYAREFNGKNQFWTPSNLGFTNALIDNKLANLEEIDISGLLPKNEANETYLKKLDAEKNYLKKSDISNLQYEKYEYNDPTYFYVHLVPPPIFYIYNRGTNKASSTRPERIPVSITNPLKIIRVRFYAFISASDGTILDCLKDLKCSITDDPYDPMKGTIHKGFYCGNFALDNKFYSYFDFSQIYYGTSKWIYIHFFYELPTTNLSKYDDCLIYLVADKTSDLNTTIEFFGI